MAKTLKDFLNERKQLGPMKVKNPDEQKFIDKHVVATVPDRNGNDDELFKGSKVKFSDRPPHRKGYNPGEDEEVYEELKGNQHKLDHNKNGKIDAHDFHLLRKKKKVAEEAEQIDELSTATLQSYRKKARAQGNAIVDKMKMGGGDWSKDQKDTKTLRKRAAGAQASGKQLVKRGESLKTEEVEQIDELSKKTLATYAIKAKNQMGRDEARAGYQRGIRTMDGKGQGEMERAHDKRAEKRSKGIDTALNKLAKEEVEQIDELSINTMANYRRDRSRTAFSGDRKPGESTDDSIKRKSKQINSMALARTKIDRARNTGSTVLSKEEVEQIDELSKETKASYMKKAGAEIDKHWDKSKTDARSAYKYYGRKNTMKKIANEEVELEEKLNMDKATMGDVIKDFQDSNAPQFKSKSKEKRRAMAIAAKLTAERGGKPLNKEERLLAKLGDLSESHQRTMVSVFEKLNEDNQRSFMAACDTPEGVEQMLDFAIQNRGE